MQRSRRLLPVRDVASNAEQQAAKALAASETRLSQAQSRLAELQRYEQDYRDALRDRTAVGIGIGELRSFQTFIAKLGEAVAQQGAIVGRATDERDAMRNRWLAATQRTQVVEKVIEHAAADERRADDRLEQVASDERAQRANPITRHPE